MKFSQLQIENYLRQKSDRHFYFNHAAKVITESAKERFAEFIKIEQKMKRRSVSQGFFAFRYCKLIA